MGFAVDLYSVFINNRSNTPENLYSRLREHLLIDAVQARDLAVLVGEQRVPVEFRLTDGPAIALRDLEVLAEMRGVGEQLFRDAADVDAGAAEAARLGDGDARAVARAYAARANTTRAAAYREKIAVETNVVT
jgi:hypothetical protein